MIRLGLRLALGAGREAIVQLVITAVAVSLGVGLLLVTLAGINAVNTQNARYAWLQTGAVQPTRSVPDGTLYWRLRADEFRGRQLGIVEVAAKTEDAPVPPGIAHLPGPDQFYASPAVVDALRTSAPSELLDRFGATRRIGEIGGSALPGPTSMIVIVGRTPAQLAHEPDTDLVARISTVVPSSCGGDQCLSIGVNANAIDLIFSVVATGLIFPVLIFIATAARLAAARREQRFATMRLVGATPRQIAALSVVESSVAAVLGAVLGVALFFAFRPIVADFDFTGVPFFRSDLGLDLADVLVVLLGVPIAGVLVATFSLRRVQISPLGVTRRVTPKPPRAWRLLLLAAGLAELGFFVLVGQPQGTPAQVEAYLPGFLFVMAGLVVAGPWLTMVAARLLAGRTRRPATLIAARRLADNPQAGFRAISGLVLALYVASVAVAMIATYTANRGSAAEANDATRTTLTATFAEFSGRGGPQPSNEVSPAELRRLRALPGVRAVTVVHIDPRTSGQPTGPIRGLVRCADIRRAPAFVPCASGVQVVSVDAFFNGAGSSVPDQPAAVAPARVARLPLFSLAVSTSSTDATESVRTWMEQHLPGRQVPWTLAEQDGFQNGQSTRYEQLADVVVLVSLPIAGCSLAASIAGGLSDRRRPFSLLRLAGSPLSMLRRVVLLESVVPLLSAAVVASGIGFLSAALFLRSQLGYSLVAPDLEYYLIVIAGLVASLLVVGSTLPILSRVTGPDAARND